jgi:hypothetical protein
MSMQEEAALRELEAANASPVPKKASLPHSAYPSQNGAMHDLLPPSPYELPSAREAAREVSFEASLSRISIQGATTLPRHSDKVPALSSLVGKYEEADAPTGLQDHSNVNSNGSSASTFASSTPGRRISVRTWTTGGVAHSRSKPRTASAIQSLKSSRSSQDGEGERVQVEQTACLQGYDPGLICLPCDIHSLPCPIWARV